MRSFIREDALSTDRLHQLIEAGDLKPWRTDSDGLVWFRDARGHLPLIRGEVGDIDEDDIDEDTDEDDPDEAADEDTLGMILDRILQLESRVQQIEETFTSPPADEETARDE